MDSEIIDGEFSSDYPYIKNRLSRSMLIRLISYIAASLSIICLLIDHLVPTGSPWAFISVAAIAYAWVSLVNILRYTPNPASIVLCQLLGIGALVFFIDYLTGFHLWSVNYVIPFLIIAAALAVTLMIVISPTRYRSNTIYQPVIALFGIFSVLLWAFGWSAVEWPAVAASGVSLLCFSAMLVFSSRRTRHELKKRFHV